MRQGELGFTRKQILVFILKAIQATKWQEKGHDLIIPEFRKQGGGIPENYL